VTDVATTSPIGETDWMAYTHAVIVAEQLKDPNFDLTQQIDLCHKQIDQWRMRLVALEKHLSYPRVLVVLHYKRYREPMTSDAAEGYTLEYAYHLLYHMTYDNGTGAPTGIEVGGCMVSWDELVAEFGDYDPW
jgi:hypothetical protein